MNETAPTRDGEGLDIEKLRGFLHDSIDGVGHKIDVEQFPAGSSNLTYLIKLNDVEFVLRRPPFGNSVKTAHDMRREFDVLSKLSQVYTPAPKPRLFCDDDSIIGSDFYLMERRHGIIVRGRFGGSRVGRSSADGSATIENSQTLREIVSRSFIQNLAALHSLDYEAAGLGELGRPDGYNRRQVDGWTNRYLAAKTDEHSELEAAMKWLGDRVPAESGASLIHNDYKFDNVMLDPDDLTHVTAVLDWEMATIGDPLMDLGTTLGYWMSPEFGDEIMNMPFNPRILMENVSRKQLVEMYASARGIDVPDMLFYYVFGTFKVAVIAQQIYARYVKGSTRDHRFANFDRFVAALGRIAGNAIERRAL